jgi:hypothetical protein
MFIKDLAITKDLTHAERAVRGGAGNIAIIGGQSAINSNSVGGFVVGSSFGPQTNALEGPVVEQSYAPVKTILDLTSLTQNVNALNSVVFQK